MSSFDVSRRASAANSWLLVVAYATAVCLSGQAHAQSLPDFTVLVEENSAAVVNISTARKSRERKNVLPEGSEVPDEFSELFRHFFERGQSERDVQSLGSGFIIDADGYIITNNHVIQGADEIVVLLSDRREYPATLVGTDVRSDISLLKIDATNLPVVRIGSGYDLKVGEWVLAIGSPFGFDYSVTAGIVSAKGRSLPSENYVPFIQTDVAINPGNSGGPLFDLNGDVVGVNSQIISRTGGYMGLSFAIPIEMAIDVAEQLKDQGRVSRGWLGVLIGDMNPITAESLGLDKPRGAVILKVLPNSPAEKAGIRIRDVVLDFDGRDVTRSSDLPPIVGSTRVGKKVPVTILRGKREEVVQVLTEELPEDGDVALTKEPPRQPGIAEIDRLGLTVKDLSAQQRETLSAEDNGVLVTDVTEGAAAAAEVREGDVILMIDDHEVRDAAHFESLVEGLGAGASASFYVLRRGNPLLLGFKTD
jgi:serine protease Do